MRNFFHCVAAAALLAALASCTPTANKPAIALGQNNGGSLRAKAGEQADAPAAEANLNPQSSNLNSQTFEGDWWPAMPSGVPSQLLVNDAYASNFNRETLLPNWVAWRLTADHASGNVQRKSASFTPDDRIDEAHRVTTYDYMRSGYDRGHLCPAGDNKWSQTAMEQCFLMTNICPQDHGLNVGDWNEMENQCRRWAKEYGEIYIVCGPILYKGRHKRIGKAHKVTVPEAFFKVVLCLEGKPKGIGFVYRNEDGNRPKGDYVNSIDQVERITGFDFFPTLPDDVEKTVEAKASLDDWQ